MEAIYYGNDPAHYGETCTVIGYSEDFPHWDGTDGYVVQFDNDDRIYNVERANLRYIKFMSGLVS